MYDALDDLTQVTQNDRIRTFGYDSLQRLASSTQPESGTATYAYDANGNLTGKTDARNVTTTYSYDALNRITQKSYSDGTPAVQWYYDCPTSISPHGKGRLWSVTNGNSTTWTYCGPRGNVASSAQSTAGQMYGMIYAHNLADALISEVYPSGRAVNTYDETGRPSTVSGTMTSVTKRYVTWSGYVPHGPLGLYPTEITCGIRPVITAGRTQFGLWMWSTTTSTGCWGTSGTERYGTKWIIERGIRAKSGIRHGMREENLLLINATLRDVVRRSKVNGASLTICLGSDVWVDFSLHTISLRPRSS